MTKREAKIHALNLIGDGAIFLMEGTNFSEKDQELIGNAITEIANQLLKRADKLGATSLK